MDAETINRRFRQMAVGLSYYDEALMRPVWDALKEHDEPRAVALVIDLAAQGAIALHDQTRAALAAAADLHGVNAEVLDGVWHLPDPPSLGTERAVALASETIDRIGARLESPLEFVRQSFRCGEWMMAFEDFAAAVSREGIELTVAEQAAMKLVLWELSPAWFEDLPLKASRSSL